MNIQTFNQERIKTLAKEQHKKGAPLNWEEFQLFSIYKKQFEKNWSEFIQEKDYNKANKKLSTVRYYDNELNKLRVKAIKDSVLAEEEKQIFYKMINDGHLINIRKLDNIILKMYNPKNQKSIFEKV